MAEEKKDKKQLVDYPGYQPGVRTPFPPQKEGGEALNQRPAREEGKTDKKPFYETYDPDPRTTDPTKTTPGAPDIHDPHTVLSPDEDLSRWSPDPNLENRYEK